MVGRHMDGFKRPLHISDPNLSFINETRLRHRVKELERLAESRNTLYVIDESMNSLIMQHLHVHVVQFAVSPAAIVSLLDKVQHKLMDRLYEIQDQPKKDSVGA